MLDPRPRHRLPTAHPSSRCCGHMHLFKIEIWNQASTLGEVPSPKLTGQVNLLTSHKEGRSVSPHLETFLLQVPCCVFLKKCMLYKLTISNDCYIQEFDNNLFLPLKHYLVRKLLCHVMPQALLDYVRMFYIFIFSVLQLKIYVFFLSLRKQLAQDSGLSKKVIGFLTSFVELRTLPKS